MSGEVAASPLALGAHNRKRRKQQVESTRSIASKSGVGQCIVSDHGRGQPTVELKKVTDEIEAPGLELVVQNRAASSAAVHTLNRLDISMGDNVSERQVWNCFALPVVSQW
jgi:hypothetical protein